MHTSISSLSHWVIWIKIKLHYKFSWLEKDFEYLINWIKRNQSHGNPIGLNTEQENCRFEKEMHKCEELKIL